MAQFDRNGVPIERIKNAFPEYSKSTVSSRVSRMVRNGQLDFIGWYSNEHGRYVSFYVSGTRTK